MDKCHINTNIENVEELRRMDHTNDWWHDQSVRYRPHSDKTQIRIDGNSRKVETGDKRNTFYV